MRFIHMTPFEANDKLILHVRHSNTKLPKFQVGDFVRVPEKKEHLFKRLYYELE